LPAFFSLVFLGDLSPIGTPSPGGAIATGTRRAPSHSL
jgi:hypothetical protein